MTTIDLNIIFIINDHQHQVQIESSDDVEHHKINFLIRPVTLSLLSSLIWYSTMGMLRTILSSHRFKYLLLYKLEHCSDNNAYAPQVFHSRVRQGLRLAKWYNL